MAGGVLTQLLTVCYMDTFLNESKIQNTIEIAKFLADWRYSTPPPPHTFTYK